MVATSGMSAALNARLQRNAERMRVAQNAMQMLARKNEYMQAMAQRKEEEDAARKERETERKEEREWRTADRTWVRGQKLADTARAEDDRRWNRLVQMAPFMTEEAINDVEPLGYSAPEMETLRGIQKEAARRRKLEEDYEAARTAELGRRNQPETTSPKENEDYLRAIAERKVSESEARDTERGEVLGRLREPGGPMEQMLGTLPGSPKVPQAPPEWREKEEYRYALMKKRDQEAFNMRKELETFKRAGKTQRVPASYVTWALDVLKEADAAATNISDETKKVALEIIKYAQEQGSFPRFGGAGDQGTGTTPTGTEGSRASGDPRVNALASRIDSNPNDSQAIAMLGALAKRGYAPAIELIRTRAAAEA